MELILRFLSPSMKFVSLSHRTRTDCYSDLQETLKRHQKQAPELVDFDFDLLSCSWDDVLSELGRAQASVSESDKDGKKFCRRAWRTLGNVGHVVSPGLSAIPDDLSVLHGGLAVIFSVSLNPT